MIISEKIKALCKARGTSLFALEKQLGLGNGTIGKWGKNGRTPNYAKLSAVCDALGVSVDEIMSDGCTPEDAKKEPAENGKLSYAQLELIELSSKMSDDELRKFIAAMKAMIGE